MSTKNLDIYKASAGSGKTYSLTREYLKILQSENEFEFKHKSGHRRILAVTFTNKATEEMKSRIVQELFTIANGDKSQMNDDDKIFKNIDEAKSALSAILHDYSRFNISTIDKFFQKIVRAFVYELDIDGNYNVTLDNYAVLEDAISSLISNLNHDSNVYKVLMQIASRNIDNGKNWNFRSELLSIGSEIFSEEFVDNRETLHDQLSDNSKLQAIAKDLSDRKKRILSELYDKAQIVIELLVSNNFDLKSDSSRGVLCNLLRVNKTDLPSFTDSFIKLENNILKALTVAKKGQWGSFLESQVAQPLDSLIDYYKNNFIEYNTADIILNKLLVLAVLTDLDNEVHENLSKSNLIMLSDTNNLIAKLIGECDTPFIYEKVGTKINHYLLDEFQDTSTMQWNNFRPLIKDSLDSANKNLVVGDVKQCIYRWRNSDWRVLGEKIQAEYKGHENEQTLKENYRSNKDIVEFNNSLFESISKTLQNQYNEISGLDDSDLRARLITDSYNIDDLKQNFVKQQDGYIECAFIAKTELESWKEQANTRLLSKIESLINQDGYNLGDIGILVRSNSEALELANLLLSNNYAIVSSESLRISKSSAVTTIIAMLRYSKEPENTENNLFLKLKGFPVLSDHSFNHESDNIDNVNSIKINTICKKSLFEAIEMLISGFGFGLDDKNTVYIQAFQDLVADFSKQNSPDISSFLEWWNQVGITKNISTSENKDAINIVTIHKSKGLAFEIVLMPYCNWELLPRTFQSPILWCNTNCLDDKFESIKQKLSFIPLQFSSALASSQFSEYYYNELIKLYIDNINLLYVAFTRAKKALICYTEYKEAKKELSSISTILLNDLQGSLDSENVYIKGTMPVSTKTSSIEQQTEQHFYPIVDANERLKLRLKSNQGELQKQGSLLHNIMQYVNIKEDLHNVLNEFERSGAISLADKPIIENELNKLFVLPQTKDWYNGSYKSLNEQTILVGGSKGEEGVQYRPDKVLIKNDEAIVIDYKFGHEKYKSHIKQVKNYMQLLKDMGYTKVKGALYYHYLSEIEIFS